MGTQQGGSRPKPDRKGPPRRGCTLPALALIGMTLASLLAIGHGIASVLRP